MERTALTVAHVAGHGILGGASSAAMGGRFQDGFLSAAASTLAMDAGLGDMMSSDGRSGSQIGVLGRTAVAGIIGGTASAIGGGKFANGAFTAAWQHLFNEEINAQVSAHYATVNQNDDGGPDPRLELAYHRGLPLGKSSFLMVDYWGYFQGSAEQGRYGLVTLFDSSGSAVGSWEFNNGGEPGSVLINNGQYQVSKHWSLPPTMPREGQAYGRYPDSGNGPAYWRDGYSFKLQISGPSASPGILFHPDGANRGTHGCYGISSNRQGLISFYQNVTSRMPLRMYVPENPTW